MELLILTLLFILGACFGSFLCCQARRLHFRTEKNTLKKIHEPRTKTKRRSSAKNADLKKTLPSRSICLHCKYQLKWYDNLPIISWLILKGKCRKCGKKIGLAELLAELGTALTWFALGFAFFNTYTPFAPAIGTRLSLWLVLVLTLILTLPLIFLAIYDALYGELPVKILYLAIALALAILAVNIRSTLTFHGFSATIILDPLFAVCILSGTYLILYLVSKGKWVGDGDWLLALALALALGTPWLALLTLFLANFLATIITLPTLKNHKSHKIHLGPYLVAAFIIVTIFSPQLSFIVL